MPGERPHPPSLREQARRDVLSRVAESAGDHIQIGSHHLCLTPLAFVSDYVETLREIDIEARALAGRLGIRQFEVMPALNDSPKFIAAFADLALKQVAIRAPV
ncbi:MAG: ferrochelatase [Acidobacteria bacterium]|nr:ferrochelatase [Acidobacteriota bacterium]